jgi:hypothetical protein
MMIDLTSDDEGGPNGEDGHEEVVFVEAAEPPKAVARVKHLYDASTTQRLVKDPETRRWIEAKRGEMDTM